MNNRNQYRLLNDAQIKDITTQIANDLKEYSYESAQYIMSIYLNGDIEGAFDVITDWVESAEDSVHHEINSALMEDTFEKPIPKTLVIHPKDESTDFLKPIYSNIENATIITGGVSKSEVRELIKTHERVIMLGHGCPTGLFSVGQFTENPYGMIIDYSMVSLLAEKKDNVFIWCNADQFVRRYNLTGLYSGMFISEVGEAWACGIGDVLQETVDESNNAFAQLLGSVINNSLIEAYNHTKECYGILSENNQVAAYNTVRLYFK